MLKDKMEVLKRISNVILGHATYNTTFESIKYENLVPEYKPTFSYNWEMSENKDIISMVCLDLVDCSKTIDRKSTLKFNVSIYYNIEDNLLSNIQIDISNLKSSYEPNAIMINDFVNNIVLYLFTGTYAVFTGRDYIALEGNEEASRIELDKNAKVSVGFNSANGVPLSIRSLFINDLVMAYKINDKSKLVESVSPYSEKLGKDLKYLLENQNTEKDDIYTLSTKSEEVDVNLIIKDFKSKKIENGKDYLYNTILNKIKRSGYASLADILTLHDGSELELESVKYIVNF